MFRVAASNSSGGATCRRRGAEDARADAGAESERRPTSEREEITVETQETKFYRRYSAETERFERRDARAFVGRSVGGAVLR